MAASRKILGYRYNHFQHKFYDSSIIIIIMVIITLHLAPSSRQILVVVRGHLPAQHYNSTTTTEMRKSQHIKCNYLFQPQKHWDCIHGHQHEPDEDVYLSSSSCWRITYNVREACFLTLQGNCLYLSIMLILDINKIFWAYLFLSWSGKDVYKSLKLIPDIGIGIPFLHLKDLARMPYIFPYTPFIYNNSEESGRSTPNDLINSIFQLNWFKQQIFL